MSEGQNTTIKVVLVTDTDEMLDALDANLRNVDDIDVVGRASDQAEALTQFRAYDPDVIVIDYDMAAVDGAELTREILHEDERVQIIMLSVVNDANDIRTAMRAGAREYLIKPLGRGELSGTIHWLIHERRAYARMQNYMRKLRKAYEALFRDDTEVPPKVVAFLERQADDSPDDTLTLETLAVAYARNREWEKLAPLAERLREMTRAEREF
ncbi:MAG: response regulator transcription factor [Chloroflexi bacterium]|nr:response regulator transcription factor [Chloroflexota bacterium]